MSAISPLSRSSSSDIYTIPEVNGVSFDFGNHVLCLGAYAYEVYEHIFERESAKPLKKLFMARQCHVDERDRAIVIHRISEVSRTAHLNTDTLHLALYIFDHCLGKFNVANFAHMQRLSAIAMVLSTKMEEYHSFRFSRVAKGGLLQMCEDPVSVLSKYEWTVLAGINFNLEIATPYTYCNYFHVILQSNESQIRLTNYILEVSLRDSTIRDAEGPRIAHACVCLAHVVHRRPQAKAFPLKEVLSTVEYVLYNGHCKILPFSNRETMGKAMRQYVQSVYSPLDPLALVFADSSEGAVSTLIPDKEAVQFFSSL